MMILFNWIGIYSWGPPLSSRKIDGGRKAPEVLPLKNVDIILAPITFELHSRNGASPGLFIEGGMLMIGKEKREKCRDESAVFES